MRKIILTIIMLVITTPAWAGYFPFDTTEVTAPVEKKKKRKVNGEIPFSRAYFESVFNNDGDYRADLDLIIKGTNYSIFNGYEIINVNRDDEREYSIHGIGYVIGTNP